MLTVAFTNQKGGVGKTAVAVCLAGELADRGKRVLLIDLEPQATATEWLGARAPAEAIEDAHGGLEDRFGAELLEALLNGKLPPIYQTPSGIDLAPSGNQLNAFEIQAARMQEGVRELLLRRSLEQLPREKWDFCFIDCPPVLGLTTINALAAADRVVMPVKLDSASRTPLVRLFLATQEVQQAFNPGLDLMGILPTFLKKQVNHSGEVLERLRETFSVAGDDLLFKTVIRDIIHVTESHGHQQPVSQYVKSVGVRNSRAAADFRDLADEFLQRAEWAYEDSRREPALTTPQEHVANA